MRLTLPALLLLTACGLEERDYAYRLAVAECRNLQTCALGYYEHEYRNQDDCVDTREERIHKRVEDWLSSCEYDPREAKRCVSRVRGLSCDEWARNDADRACDLVYDCTR